MTETAKWNVVLHPEAPTTPQNILIDALDHENEIESIVVIALLKNGNYKLSYSTMSHADICYVLQALQREVTLRIDRIK